MKTLLCTIAFITVQFQSSAQTIPPQQLIEIFSGRQTKSEIVNILGDRGLIYGDYKDSLLRLSNQSSLTNDEFVLFEIFLDDRNIAFRVCKKSVYEGWHDELENIGFSLLGSQEHNGAMTGIYAKGDQRVAVSVDQREKSLKYKLFIYRV